MIIIIKTNKFQVALRLYSYRSQKTVQNVAIASCATFLFLPPLDVICVMMY